MTTTPAQADRKTGRTEHLWPETHADHRRLYEWVQHEFRLSDDGVRLLRLRSDRRKPPKVIAPTGKGTTKEIMLGGVYAYAHCIAHVLRVGPEGPLRPLGPWRPRDGDWLNVHPDNWEIAPAPTQPRGAAGRAAALRARAAAYDSRLAVRANASRPLYRARVIEDARYWWVQAVAAWGGKAPELDARWPYAAEHAQRYWALSHYLAWFARKRLAETAPTHEAGPAAGAGVGALRAAEAARIEAVRLACLEERTAVMSDPLRWAHTVAWAVLARQRGELHDSPEQAGRTFAAARTDAAAPTSDDADLY